MIILTVTYCMIANAQECFQDKFTLPSDYPCERGIVIAKEYMAEHEVRDVSVLCSKGGDA